MATGYSRSPVLQKILNWFKNNKGFLTGARKHVSARKVRLDDGGKRFSKRDGAKHLFQDRLALRAAELTPKGDKVFKYYQTALTEVIDELDEEDQQKLDAYLEKINDPNTPWLFRPCSE